MSLPIERRFGQSDANKFSGRMVQHLGVGEFTRLQEMGRKLDVSIGGFSRTCYKSSARVEKIS